MVTITISREQFFNDIKKRGDKDGKICKETQHYLDYYDKYHATGKKANLNWSAAIFGGWCFIYRGMYAYFFIFSLLKIHFWPLSMLLWLIEIITHSHSVNSLIEQNSFVSGLIGLSILFFDRLIYAYFFDYLYLRNVNLNNREKMII